MNKPLRPARNFLFLQGMATGFFAGLGAALLAQGHGVRKLNFNGGDRLFWPPPGTADYRGSDDAWPAFLKDRLAQWQITDIVLFGDCRPLHRIAIRLAVQRGIPVHVFEEGYLRPNWITLERGGVNDNSSLPRDSETYRAAAQNTPPWNGGTTVRNSFLRRAVQDVLYNLATVLLMWRYPHYRTHRLAPPLLEYVGGAGRFLRRPFAKRATARLLREIIANGPAYYLFPLQLETDSQIRHHSPFGRMEPAIASVIDSFAKHAPNDALLVISEHPLDTSMSNWRRIVPRLAAAAGVAARVRFVYGGSPEELIRRSRGLITVNSTAGILGLNFAVPVIALGHAIYGLPGLTFQGALDDFWCTASPPDGALFDAFRRVVAARTQVNGGFFSRAGLALAVQGAVMRLAESAHVPRFELYAAVPAADDAPQLRVAQSYG